jgi:hypothetical protein
MAEQNSGIGPAGQTLIFTSRTPKFGSAAFLGIILFGAIFAFAAMSETTPAGVRMAVGFLLILVAGTVLLNASRQWTAEIDLASRRLRVFRRSFGRWTRTTVDCPLDECSALGTFEYESDGHFSYTVYVKLKDGTRQAIPLTNSALNEAARVASQLSARTGIPRLDIYVGPIYITPDDTASHQNP